MRRDQARYVFEQLGSHKFIDNAKGFMTNCPIGHNHKGGFDRTPSMQVFDGDPTIAHCFGCKFKGKLFFLAKESGKSTDSLLGFIDGNEGWDSVSKAKNLPDYDEIPNAVRYASQETLNMVKRGSRKMSASGDWFSYDNHVENFEQTIFKVDEDQIKKWQSAKFPEYLKKRGIKEQTYQAWRLGFDEDGINHEKEKNGKKYIVNFGPRAMFVVYDEVGKVIGFSGRSIYSRENSPEFKIASNGLDMVILRGKPRYYHAMGWKKENSFFGTHMIDRRNKTAVVVEGPLDAISLWQVGVKNTLALFGSYLSDYQCDFLVNNFTRVVLMPDGDAPGLLCMEKAFEKLQGKITVKIAGWVDGKDPDDISKDKVMLNKVLAIRHKISEQE